MKKTSIALCAVLFWALVMTNVFAEEADVATATSEETTLTTTGATTTGAEATTWTATTETGATAETGASVEETTGAVASTGDTTTTGEIASTGAVAESGAVAEEATTGDVVEEVDVNATLHAMINKYFEDNASKYKTLKSKSDFITSLREKVAKAAESARANYKAAYDILKGALESYKVAE